MTDRDANSSPLFEPVQLGSFNIGTRIVYAPLTRQRALGSVPQPAAIKYYTQRARKGLLMVSEGTVVTSGGQGEPHIPGIYSQEQIDAWSPIVKAVKEKGAIFFQQIWHVGRSSHPEYQPEGRAPIAPSAVRISTDQKVFAPKTGEFVSFTTPRALEISEIPGIVQLYVKAARNSLKAGFDGVEIHGANGYLLDQFLKQSANKRTDEYGGSIQNRCRLMLEVVEAVVKEVGDSGRVGLRLSPFSRIYNDCKEPDVDSTLALNTHLLEQLNKFNLAYVHIVTARADGIEDVKGDEKATLKPLRAAFKGNIIAAGGFIKQSAEEEIKSGNADLIAFGRWFLSNPDFMERLKADQPMNKYNRDTFYIHDQAKGYTDYPFFDEVDASTRTEKHYSGMTVFAPPKQKTAAGHEP